MTENMTVAGRAPVSEPYRWRWLAFSVVLMASIMNLLDTLITNIAAPSIQADLGGGASLIQWLAAGYTLALAAGLITGGRLGDIYGRKTIFLIGAAGFTVTSMMCAFATSSGMLIGSRVAQGLFGAIMLPQGLGVIRSIFPPKELPTAFGAFGPAMGLATVGGPVLAGALINADILGSGWRMIFLINLPLGLFALLAGARFLPGGQMRSAVRLDTLGAVIAAVAALLLVYPVVQGRALGWPSWTFVLIAASLVLFVVFGKVESRTVQRGGDPLIIPSLFSNRAFSGGLVTGLAIFTSMVGFSLVLTVFLQLGLGFSPLKAGLTVLPQAVGSMFGFVAAGAGLARKLGRKALHLGTLLMLLGVIGVFLVLRGVGIEMSPWHLAPVLFVYGVGLGIFLAPFFDIILAGVAPREYGSASGSLNAVQQFGSALGVAVVGTVFFGIVGGQVAQSIDGVASPLRGRLEAADVSPVTQDQLIGDLRSCRRDSTVSTYPAAVPASCRQLDTDMATAASTSTDPTGVRSAVQQAGAIVTKQGFSGALQQTIWTVAGLLIVVFTLAFLLPPHARRFEDRTAVSKPA